MAEEYIGKHRSWTEEAWRWGLSCGEHIEVGASGGKRVYRTHQQDTARHLVWGIGPETELAAHMKARRKLIARQQGFTDDN